MANFNDKVLCLFKKNCEQLKKEMKRRGMRYESREKAIAKTIWKDAYDAGITEGKDIAKRSEMKYDCNANYCGNAPQIFRAYCLHDVDNNIKYRLELTSEQVRMFQWLQEMEYLTDLDLTDWSETFEDIGRI